MHSMYDITYTEYNGICWWSAEIRSICIEENEVIVLSVQHVFIVAQPHMRFED